MKKYMLMLVFMASILWGCGNSLKEGEIYEKTFTPEHYDNTPFRFLGDKDSRLQRGEAAI